MVNPFLRFIKPPFAYKRSQYVADSQTGGRDENQDNYLLVTPHGNAQLLKNEAEIDSQHNQWSEYVYRLAVADGMGGHKGGREISEALIEKLLLLKPQKSLVKLRESIFTLHQQLWQSFSTGNNKSPGTTLIMADVYENGTAYIVNIGDSRAYLWRDNQWQCLTYDQTLDEYDWRDDEIEDEDYIVNEKSNILLQAIGYGSYGLIKDEEGHKLQNLNKQLRLDLATDLPREKQAHADCFKLTLQQGDALLLASDGLWSVEKNKPLLLPSPQAINSKEKLRQFLWDVIENGGSDNVTAVMLWSGDTIISY